MKWIKYITIFFIFLTVLFVTVRILIINSSYIFSLLPNIPSISITNTSKTVISEAVPLETVVSIDKWKTYKNDIYNYSIHYRPDFQIREFENKTWVSIDNLFDDRLPDEKDWFLILIKIQPNDSSLSPRKYIELYAKSNPNCRKNILDSFVEYKNNIINGIRGNIDPCSDLPNNSVIFTNNDYAYIFELKSDKSFNPSYTDTKLKLFDQILSTFNFFE